MDTILRSLLRQPPRRGDGEPEIRASGLIGQLLLLFASFFLSSMYVSVVMSLLSVDTAPPTPNTLEDLAIRFPEMKIYVPHRGVALEVLKISSEYPLLEKRLETVNLFDLQDRRALEVFSNIINGTHVYIEVGYYNLELCNNHWFACRLKQMFGVFTSTLMKTSDASCLQVILQNLLLLWPSLVLLLPFEEAQSGWKLSTASFIGWKLSDSATTSETMEASFPIRPQIKTVPRAPTNEKQAFIQQNALDSCLQRARGWRSNRFGQPLLAG